MKPIQRINNEEFIYSLNKDNNVTRGTLIEIHTADIHFGAIDPKLQYDILCEQFLNKIIDLQFDILSINGDIFDRRYMTKSVTVMYANMFINKVVDICKSKNATLVMIHGTLSHDAEQIKMFYRSDVDIRIVESVRFEYIKGAKILCIPEMYGMGEEYYNNFLYNSGIYDSVFGHGMIKGAIYTDNITTVESAPVFDIDSFAMCTGPIIFGHVHVPGCFHKYCYYCGSPIRYSFGEEQEKGFFIVLHNLDTQQHYAHLEPIKSFRYDTIDIDSMLIDDPKNVISYINELQQSGIDYIRLEYKKELTDIEISNLQLLKSYYKNKSNIKIKQPRIKKQESLKINDEILDKYKDYEFILDKNLSPYEILSKYINKQKGCEYITCEELKSILEEKI